MNNKKKKIIIISCLLFVIGVVSITIGYIYLSDRTKEGYYTLRLDKNGASSLDSSRLECKIENNECQITLPNATRKKGVVLGYSTNKNATSPEYKIGDVITMKSDMRMYAISYQKLTMNIVSESVDYISTPDVSCNVYNKNDSCEVVPGIFNKEGYEVRGYSTSPKSQAGYIYPNTKFELDEDITVYPIWNTYTRGIEINVSESFQRGSMTFDVENGCPSYIYDEYLEIFDKIEKNAPYLVIGTKVSFLTDETFDKIWGPGYVGMNYGPTDLRMMDVRCGNNYGNNYYATIVHEMGHTWDFHYKSMQGNEITKQGDVINLFNEYKPKADRPFRDYSYSDIREFFADMVRYYYLKYTDPISEFEMRFYPENIKKVLEKYICITNNNYESGKCK